MTGRLNKQYEARMRRVVNQHKEQIAALEASMIAIVTAINDINDSLNTDVQATIDRVDAAEAAITTLESDVETLQDDVLALEAIVAPPP